MQKIKLRREPRIDARLKAFPYQIEALRAIQEKDYSAIFHEQGLGKSKIAIDLMLYWLEKKEIDTVLFIVKKGLIYNWLNEFSIHSYIKPKILGQNRNSNYYVFNSPSRLILTHYEVIRSELGRFRLFLKSRNVAAILDESTKIKNPRSSLTKALFELVTLFKKRVIMTGTPIANRPFDIWAQIWFLDQGNSLGVNFSKFKKNMNLESDLGFNHEKQKLFEGNLEKVFSHIENFTVRETKKSGIIKLPEKSFQTIECDWESKQFDLYRQIQEKTRAIVIKDGIPKEENADALLKRILRLVQIASQPRLIDESYSSTPGKMVELLNIVTNICHSNEKCIIWTSFTNNVDWISSELHSFGSCKIHGKLDISRRHRAVESFLNDDTKRILVATPGSAKEGLTLTVANHVLFYDRTFSLDDYLQAQDRVHRISQKKQCHVYNFIMRDSIDEWIDILIANKQLAAQLAQRDISLNYYKTRIYYDFGTIIRKILNIQ